MPSFSSSIAVTRLPNLPSGDASFSCNISDVWSVNGTPHGGYLLSVILSAVSDFQKTTNQPDPAHLMTSFYRAARNGEGEIRIKIMKKGLRWTNLEARLLQNGELLIVSHILYTLLPPLPSASSTPFSTTSQNLLPLTPSTYAPLTPLLTHPSLLSSSRDTKPHEWGRRWSDESVFWFVEDSSNKDGGGWMRWSEDVGVKKRREEGKELEWGGWLEFTDKADRVGVNSLPFFADMFSSIPELLPGDERIDSHYYPTLALSMQFHCSLPLPSSSGYISSPQTVGCYSNGKAIHEGRHEQVVEVWSSPSPIGVGEVEEDWRKSSILLASATQLALSVGVGKMKTGIKTVNGKL